MVSVPTKGISERALHEIWIFLVACLSAATLINAVNVNAPVGGGHVTATVSYHFVIAAWRTKEAKCVPMKDWEIIPENLHDAGWSLGWVSALDVQGRTIWIVDARP